MKKLLILSFAILTLPLLQAADPVGKDAETDVDDTQDVIYLGVGRPAVLRLHLRSGGKAVQARYDAFMTKFFHYLDRNQSGGLDRAEGRMMPSAQQMALLLAGNIYNTFQRQATSEVSFEAVDTDRDGKVTLEEFKAYYQNNNAGPVVAPAQGALRSGSARLVAAARENMAQDPVTDALFGLLDTNKDNKLSREEFQRAEKTLFRLDTNDDELISRAELSGSSQTNPYRAVALRLQVASGSTQATNLVVLPASAEGKKARLDAIRGLIQTRDADKDGKLTQTESGFPADFFKKLDRNKDDKLDLLELSRWLGGKADAEMTVRLAGLDGAMMKGGRTSGRSGDDMSLVMGNVKVSVVPVNDGAGVANISPFFLGQFRTADPKKRGYLMRREVTPQSNFYIAAIFDLADRNADGRLTEEELKAYIDLVREAYGSQVSLSLVNTGQGLFRLLDANNDGQLSIRELRGAWSRLERFDTDRDGCLSRDELPVQYSLNVSSTSNGAFLANPELNGIGYTPATAPGRGPLWFRKMDRNGDGDVSRTEWLGSKEAFDRIDTDGDGLISAEEAEAFDARSRKG